MRIEINYTNEYGEEFSISRKVDSDWTNREEEMDEIDFLHDSYKTFLNTMGYPVDNDKRIAILGSNEYIEDICDGDCENCDMNEDENFEDDEDYYSDLDEAISETLKDHAKEIANIVAEEFNKSRTNISWKDYIKSV